MVPEVSPVDHLIGAPLQFLVLAGNHQSGLIKQTWNYRAIHEWGIWAILSGTAVLREEGKPDRRVEGPALLLFEPGGNGPMLEVPPELDYHRLIFTVRYDPSTHYIGGGQGMTAAPIIQPNGSWFGVDIPQEVTGALADRGMLMVKKLTGTWWRGGVQRLQASWALGSWFLDLIANISESRPAEEGWIGQLSAMVRDRLHQGVQAADLAEAMGYSYSQFARKFKDHTNKSPQVWLQEIRLEEACRMLAQTDNSVPFIAQCCGYRRIDSLSRRFKQTFGCSPSQWRRQQGRTGFAGPISVPDEDDDED